MPRSITDNRGRKWAHADGQGLTKKAARLRIERAGPTGLPCLAKLPRRRLCTRRQVRQPVTPRRWGSEERIGGDTCARPPARACRAKVPATSDRQVLADLYAARTRRATLRARIDRREGRRVVNRSCANVLEMRRDGHVGCWHGRGHVRTRAEVPGLGRADQSLLNERCGESSPRLRRSTGVRGSPAQITDEEILRRLLEWNLV